MKNEKMEVAVIGALNIDICGSANVAFSSGDSLPGEVSIRLGGAGFNMARNAAALGAGEAMTAALAVALLRGLDLPTTAKFAAAAAAIVCQSRESLSPELARLRDIAEPKKK